MYISRAYNKKMNVWYAYEVEYVWDEMKQKKVQKRKCIGQIDPDSDRIIPNGKRGPARSVPGTLGTTETGSPTSGPVSARQTTGTRKPVLTRRKMEAKIQKLARTLDDLSQQMAILSRDLLSLIQEDPEREEGEDSSTGEEPECAGIVEKTL